MNLNFNPYKNAFHKFSIELLKDKYNQNAELIERICCHFQTENDTKLLSNLFIHLFENGYLSATDQYADELKKLGITVSIVPKQN